MKDKIIAKIDACEEALVKLEEARKACVEAVKKARKVFESADAVISKAHEDHDAPEGFFASDPVGEILGDLDNEGLGTDLFDQAFGFLDGRTWDSEWRKIVRDSIKASREIAKRLP